MKKIFTFFAALVCAAVSVCAQNSTISFTVVVDDPTHAVVALNGEPVTPQADGSYAISAAYENYSLPMLSIYGVSPYEIKAATYTTAYSDYEQGLYVSNGRIDNSYYTDLDGVTLNVTTYNPEAERTATLNLTVDDASMVNAMIGQRALTLSNGSNAVKFNPSTETYFSLAPRNYSVPLYKVTLNSEALTAQGTSYNFPVKDGDALDIIAQIPAEPVELSFAFPGEDLSADLKVSINGQPAIITDGKVAAVTGQAIVIEIPSTYKLNSFAVDGNQTGIYGAYNGTVLGNTIFTIDATKYATYKVTVNANTDFVTLYNSSYASGTPLEIAADGTIELPENNNVIYWEAKPGCYIESVSINGEPFSGYGTSTNLTDGAILEIVAGEYVMDNTAIIWVDDVNAVDTYFSLQASNRDQINLDSGYNTVKFHSGMTPFTLNWYSNTPVIGKVYINGVLREPMYEGSSNYELPLADGDIVKIYFAAEPVEAKANITIADDAEATILRDHVTSVEAGEHTVLSGTEFTISGTDLEVKAGNTTVLPDENGNYIVKVDGDTDITVANADKTGINQIDAAPAARAIYDLQGRRLAAPARGLNIINGRKVIF